MEDETYSRTTTTDFYTQPSHTTLFISALNCQNLSGKIPIWMMRQAGRYQPSYRALKEKYTFQELCYTPELASQVTLLPIQEMKLDAAILFSDILFPLEALGLKVTFSNLSVPRVLAGKNDEDTVLGRLKTVLNGNTQSLLEICKPIYHTIPLVLAELSNTPLIGFSGAPWTLLTYILSGETSEKGEAVLSLLRENAEQFIKLLQKVEKLVIEHLSLQITSGCHVVQLFDSWAGAVPNDVFEMYIAPSLTRIVAALQKIKKCPIIYYTKGVEARLEALSWSGLHMISCDTVSSIEKVHQWAKKEKIAVQGNLDPFLLCRDKSDRELNEALSRLLTTMGHAPNYVFNLGHGIPKDANYDTVQYVVNRVHEWK